MRVRQLLCVLVASVAALRAQAPAAFVHVNDDGALAAVLTLNPEPKPCAEGERSGCGVTVTLFQGAASVGGPLRAGNAPWRVRIPSEYRRGTPARVLVQAYEDMQGGMQPAKLLDLSAGFKVEQLTAGKGSTGDPVPGLVNCDVGNGEWLNVRVAFDPPIGADYAKSRLQVLRAWSQSLKGKPGAAMTAEFQIGPGGVTSVPIRAATFHAPNFNVAPNAPLEWIGCLEPEIALPTEAFRSTLTFAGGAPFELAEPIIQEKGQGIAAVAAMQADLKSEVGKRAFDRDLDVGVALTSGLEKITQPGGKSALERRTRGTLDLRLVPVRAWQIFRRQQPVRKNDRPSAQQWFPTWSPFFLDARIATGPIEAGSASLNIVSFGTQIELFYLPRNQSRTYKNGHRFLLRGVNSSDRDFKQAEARFSGEYSPALGIWNRPLATRLKVDPFSIGANRFRLVPASRFGYRFIPVAGGDLGSTWRRHNPAVAVKPTDALIRRVFFGGDLTFEVTRRLTLSAKDRFYLRGEEPTNKTRNYFKAETLVQVGDFSANFSHGISVSFERGALPPFTTDANAFVLGYRVLLQRWK